MIESELSQERLLHYLDVTKSAREKVSLIVELSAEDQKKADILLEMADAYIYDAGFFFEKGDYIRSFGAINYAHAWIDAGVKLKLLDGHNDDVLFTLP